MLSAVPRTFTEFLVARFLGGLGIGACSMICPVYIAELAPAEKRGRMGSLFQFGIVTGIFVTLFINALIQDAGDGAWNASVGWRWMFGAEVLPAVVMLTLVFAAPESPRWLILVGRESEARAILERLHEGLPPEEEILAVRAAASHEDGRLAELFGPRFRTPLIVAVTSGLS